MKTENKILNLFHATTMSRGLQIIKDGEIRTDAPSVICWSLETTPGWIYLSDQLDNAVHWGNKIACLSKDELFSIFSEFRFRKGIVILIQMICNMCRGYLLRRQKTQTCIHVFLFAIPAEQTKNCIKVVKYQIMQSFLQQHCILTIQDILNMILLIR